MKTNAADNQSRFRVVPSTPAMAEQLEAIQAACFPTLAANERITAAQYRKHAEIFPEGQMSLLDETGRVAACSTDLICAIDFDHYQHSYMEASGNNWLTTHNPQGDWLYGVDIGVHPDFRGLGLSKILYDARKDLARRLNLKGHVAGGMLKGYGEYKDKMPVADYIAQIAAGTIFDPTVSVQLRRGFKIRGILENYLDDPVCDNKAALIVWENPDYRP